MFQDIATTKMAERKYHVTVKQEGITNYSIQETFYLLSKDNRA